jgi:hypothetical protein
MKMKVMTWMIAAACVAATSVQAADLKSGLQVGDAVGAFYVEKVGGAEDGVAVGKKLCYRCRMGSRPTVMIFTRSADKQVASLLKQIDSIVAANKDSKAGSFVSVLGADSKSAKATAAKLGSYDNVAVVVPVEKDVVAGAANQKISAKADLTVVIMKGGKVAANHAFAKGSLDAKAIKAIIADAGSHLK